MNKAEMKEVILSEETPGADLGSHCRKGRPIARVRLFGLSRHEQTAQRSAEAIADTLGLGPQVAEALQEFPHKSWDKMVPTDPVIYCWYEIVGSMARPSGAEPREIRRRCLIAIDFTMDIDKQEDPRGDRVV